MNLQILFTAGLAALVTAMPSGTSSNWKQGQNLTTRGEQTVRIVVGGISQIVGPLEDGPLYGAIYTALDSLCPQGSSHCKLQTEGQAEVNIRFKSPQDILTAPMAVRIERSNHETEQIRRLLIGTVTGSVEAMVTESNKMDDKNCKEIWLGPKFQSGYFKSCTISNYIGVTTTDRVNIMDVHFLSVDDHGKWDCPGTIDSIQDKAKSLQDEYGQALGGPVTLETACI
ncbi:hypothetical protein K491DRAFT_762267 [Lophiostoma macrostomum CBS 122681]|uniref:Secreted protein n=1 Tax=Lophiostoma macrostomum CBS 122681 TaxID=1314788 RepID=A0A6A6STW8_9PLEO|nr:hypothetical protein K491DRAFT_762267 [Lophiostoma macrostomum CBS 122681]